MSQWPSTRASRVLAALLRIGWRIKRQVHGSHRVLARDGWMDFVFAFHDSVDLHRRGVRRTGIHAASHVWIERQVEVSEEHLAAVRRWDFDLFQSKISILGLAFGTRGEHDSSVSWHQTDCKAGCDPAAGYGPAPRAAAPLRSRLCAGGFGPSERGYSGFGIFLEVLERLGLGGVPLQDLDG